MFGSSNVTKIIEIFLLCFFLRKEGLNPTEYCKMRDSLDCPVSEESQREASLLQMLQGW